MKVFVAGAMGVLGRSLIPRLIAGRHSVRAVAGRASTSALPSGIEAVDADLLEDDLLRLVRGCDAVVNLGAAIPADARECTGAARRLVDAALACHVPRYVQQGLVTTYRDGGNAWLDEGAPLDHAAGRAAICGPAIEIETIIREVEPQALAWTILRGGSLVGAGTDEATTIERLQRGDVVVAGDGSNYFSPVNVIDMADAIAAALERAPAGSTFNIVDEPLRYGDYVDALADLIGVPRPPRLAQQPLPPSWRCSNEAAQAVLEWRPREPIWPYVGADTEPPHV